MPPSKKGAKFDLSDLSKWPLGGFNQIHIFTMHRYHPKEATCQKRKKVIRQFLRNQAFNWKVDDDGRRRRTTDESALEKLRCLSAGGANKREGRCEPRWAQSDYWSLPPPPHQGPQIAKDVNVFHIWKTYPLFFFVSSAVPPGSRAFQMPTRPSSASTLRGGRTNLRNASVTFSLFLHEASLGWH